MSQVTRVQISFKNQTPVLLQDLWHQLDYHSKSFIVNFLTSFLAWSVGLQKGANDVNDAWGALVWNGTSSVEHSRDDAKIILSL